MEQIAWSSDYAPKPSGLSRLRVLAESCGFWGVGSFQESVVQARKPSEMSSLSGHTGVRGALFEMGRHMGHVWHP